MESGIIFEQLARLLGQDLDRVTKAKELAKLIRSYGVYRWVGLYDVDLVRGVVANIAWDGPGPPAYPVFPISKGLTARAIATKSTVNVGDVGADPGYLTALATTRSEIIVPVLDQARTVVMGTIDVESENPHAFDSAAVEFLETCASVLSDSGALLTSFG